MHEIRRLLDGFERFRVNQYERAETPLGMKLSSARQPPRTAVITCSDCPIDPAVLFDTDPGDLYHIRNVGGVVPPYEIKGSYHGTSASIEYAVCAQGVRHIVVLGHSECDAIATLLRGLPAPANGIGFVNNWLSIVADVRSRVMGNLAAEPPATRARAAEHNVVLVSMINLLTFPWLQERVERRALFVHGWYLDLQHGELQRLDPSSGRFDAVTERMYEAE